MLLHLLIASKAKGELISRLWWECTSFYWSTSSNNFSMILWNPSFIVYSLFYHVLFLLETQSKLFESILNEKSLLTLAICLNKKESHFFSQTICFGRTLCKVSETQARCITRCSILHELENNGILCPHKLLQHPEDNSNGNGESIDWRQPQR